MLFRSVDVDNPYKDSRPVFDSSFRPKVFCEAINDWIDPDLEGDISFRNSVKKYLKVIYNMRITYPFVPIYQADDNITNAFRLFKYNPVMVAMHAFWGHGYLGFCTGMTFGDNASPANFDIAAVV